MGTSEMYQRERNTHTHMYTHMHTHVHTHTDTHTHAYRHAHTRTPSTASTETVKAVAFRSVLWLVIGGRSNSRALRLRLEQGCNEQGRHSVRPKQGRG